jgi:hypothetical protein
MAELRCGTCGQLDEDIIWDEGWKAAIEMVIDKLDFYDSNELAKLSVYEFIEKFKDNLHEQDD